MKVERHVLAYAALYVAGIMLFLLPMDWVRDSYFLALALVVAWSALAGFAVYRARKRLWLVATLGPMAAMLILMIVSVSVWSPQGLIF